jgi:hypothetical protein
VIFADPPIVIVLIDRSRGQRRLDHVGHRRHRLGADR